MQEEVTQKTMAFSIKSAKLTAQVLQAAARKFLEARNKGKTKLHHGQQSLKQLKKHGAALSNIEITDANIGLFRPCAKKYGVDFTLRKDATTHPPHYIVIFKAKDADIPFGKVTIVQGNPGEGKTTFALRLAAACTTGGTLPGMKPLPPFQVIYQTAEDGLG
ncbi:PcfB family protein, partial [Pseudoflavonifractor phocaeensis]|uniref:PcfB family protein n=1 Tax=Pseudoflavonifractor phocaeensis TaxID=1870988 RepID=UPI001FAEFAF0